MVDDEFASLQLKAAILFFTCAATVLIYFRFLHQPKRNWKSELSSTKTSSINSNNYNVKDVWGERRKRGVTASSSSSSFSKRTSSAEDKPFGSSYYYAHNNPNATGGYKDGLRMEDYTMNQPRLLSKNGVSAGEPDSSDSAAVPASSSSASSTVRKRVNTPVAKKISKFLWDDPGDSNGIATIRIDVLPGATLTETISWRQANIVDTTATLIDDKRGLLIEVESEEGTRFRLQIPKLYGQVDEVRKVVKPNRLIVRLYKTRGWTNKKNLQAWPNP
jgi:hypothetical protein